MKKKKILFLDVISINKNNISSFLESEEWPVSEPLFRSLTNFIFEEYTKEILKFKGKAYKLAVIELSFLSILINALHYNYIKNFCIKNNYKYIYHKSTNKFLNPNWDELSKSYEKFNYPYNKLQRFLRKIIKLFYFNLHLSLIKILKGIFSKKENISLGSFDNIKQDYIKKSKKFFVHIEWVDLINKSIVNNKIRKHYSLNNNTIKKILIKIANKSRLKPFIKSLDFDKINLTYNHRVSSLSLIYDNLLTLKTPREIIFTESPKTYHKIISSVFLGKGAKVINFNHGNSVGLVHQKWTQTYFYAQSGNYGFESNNTCKTIKKAAQKIPLASRERTKFFSVNSEIGLKRKNIIYKKIKKESIKKVMFMGYPMNITRYTGDVYCFFHYKLKLEINILKKLRKLGYYIIYKAHPDRLMEIGNLMNDYADECDNNKFEKVWNKADALIFTYCTTTTFGFAITTPLPIVLLNETATDWDHKKKLQIQKRIHILDYKYSNATYKEISYMSLNKGLKIAQNKITIDKIKQI